VRSYVIDGRSFTDLEGFFDEVSRKLIPGVRWGRNLDAFDDILRGGFGTPEDGFELAWESHEHSQDALGHAEAARQLERRLQSCHPDNRALVENELKIARAGSGPTVFDWLIEIIRDHGVGGSQEEDDVILSLL
jgi:RNAse (barnase) inhibitor barstar